MIHIFSRRHIQVIITNLSMRIVEMYVSLCIVSSFFNLICSKMFQISRLQNEIPYNPFYLCLQFRSLFIRQDFVCFFLKLLELEQVGNNQKPNSENIQNKGRKWQDLKELHQIYTQFTYIEKRKNKLITLSTNSCMIHWTEKGRILKSLFLFYFFSLSLSLYKTVEL